MQDCTPKLVLIADDNADAGDTLGAFLEILGFQVEVVRDGVAAVQRAREISPDLVILDLGMPGLDGWAACKEIRELPGGDRVRVVALSGWGSAEARQKSVAAGFDAHWTKPTDPAKLLAGIRG